MKLFISILLFSISSSLVSFSQGGLDHIKNQKYLKHYHTLNINCDSIPDSLASMLTYRICANLKLQERDSVLSLYYDSLKTELGKYGGEKLLQKFDSIQITWRNYRDLHCKTKWNTYEDASSGHMKAIIYMNEMTKLTDIKIAEFIKLIHLYREEKE